MTPVGRAVAVLTALDEFKQSAATYVIRNIVSSTWGLRDGHLEFRAPPWPGATTPKVLSTCKSLEAVGHIERVPTSYARMLSWALTDSGREILTQIRTAAPKGGVS